MCNKYCFGPDQLDNDLHMLSRYPHLTFMSTLKSVCQESGDTMCHVLVIGRDKKILSFPVTFQDLLGSVGRNKFSFQKKKITCQTEQTQEDMNRSP